MITFNTVMLRVREVLQEHTGKPKILDRDIASALRLDPKYFAVIKRRGKIPYEALAYFCQKHHISLNWILLAQKPRELTKR
jgi:hypothetical protein